MWDIFPVGFSCWKWAAGKLASMSYLVQQWARNHLLPSSLLILIKEKRLSSYLATLLVMLSISKIFSFSTLISEVFESCCLSCFSNPVHLISRAPYHPFQSISWNPQRGDVAVFPYQVTVANIILWQEAQEQFCFALWGNNLLIVGILYWLLYKDKSLESIQIYSLQYSVRAISWRVLWQN